MKKKSIIILLLIVVFELFISICSWADIFIDNTDPECSRIGSDWGTRSNPPWPSYGNNFSFSMTGNGADQAIYSFYVPESGQYEVYAWWPSHPYCSRNTPYHIPFSDGAVTVRVNQQQNSAQWNLLASGYFEEGEHEIIVSDDASGILVVADAVRIISIP